MQIATYRLIRTGTTDALSVIPTLNGVNVLLASINEEESAAYDQNATLEAFYMESTDDIDLKKGDQVVDNLDPTLPYVVHTVRKNPSFDIGPYTLAIVVRPRSA